MANRKRVCGGAGSFTGVRRGEKGGSMGLPVTRRTGGPRRKVPLVSVRTVTKTLAYRRAILRCRYRECMVPVFGKTSFLVPIGNSDVCPGCDSNSVITYRHIPVSGVFFR